MEKANGLGPRIDNSIATMKAAYRTNNSLTKKQLHDIAIEKAGGAIWVTKVADRKIWAAVFDLLRNPVEHKDNDYRNDEEYR